MLADLDAGSRRLVRPDPMALLAGAGLAWVLLAPAPTGPPVPFVDRLDQVEVRAAATAAGMILLTGICLRASTTGVGDRSQWFGLA